MRSGQPVALLPVLVGSLDAYVRGGADISSNQVFEEFIAQCQAVMRSRRTLVVISGDLSHVGPAFEGAALRAAGKDKLRKSDAAIIAAASTGQPDRFLSSVAAIGDRTNICGVAPLYLGLSVPTSQAGFAVSVGINGGAPETIPIGPVVSGGAPLTIRDMDPPIVVRPGDIVSIGQNSNPTPTAITLGGYFVYPGEV